MRKFSQLKLSYKIYLSLIAILIPVFILTIFIQLKVTRPFFEDEIRQLGLAICQSLATDITNSQLLQKQDQLESRLIELSWKQPNITRIDVFTKDSKNVKFIASSISEEPPEDAAVLAAKEGEISELQTIIKKDDSNRTYWDITFPILDKSHKQITGYIHAEASLQLFDRLQNILFQIASLGAFLSIFLLILLLSFYLRRTIENESKLRNIETQNLALTEQLHEMQRRLFNNEKLAIMGQLTASIAHEIGTPLNSLSGHLQLLKETTSNHQDKERIDIIDSQVSRIEGIVKQFLASTNTPQQQLQLVEPDKLIYRILSLVRPRLDRSKVETNVIADQEIQPIRIVPTDLEQVFLNLTNNALDAMEKSQQNKLTYILKSTYNEHSQKKILDITIEDSGEGIAPHTLKNILKPFFTTKPPGQGTGLGLTICQRLIKKYNGDLSIYSTLGKGTQIRVSLPYDA